MNDCLTFLFSERNNGVSDAFWCLGRCLQFNTVIQYPLQKLGRNWVCLTFRHVRLCLMMHVGLEAQLMLVILATDSEFEVDIPETE